MTAEKAREISRSNFRAIANSNMAKYEELILQEANRGKFYIVLSYDAFSFYDIKDYFIEQGYKLSLDLDSNTIIISWRE